MIKKVILSICLSLSSLVFAKDIALSFDDGLNPESNLDALQINNDILKTLKANNVSAIVYPSISKIGGKQGLDIISEWGKQGHRIGNHGNLHLNLNKGDVTLTDYLVDMEQGHQAFSSLQGFVPRYRFPFLKEGNTVEKRDGVREWLSAHKYQSGAVSIDASDWYYNQLFLKYKNKNDQESLDKLKQAYIAHLLDRAEYYDGLAVNTLGRSPKHILLLHVRAINAAWLGDIINSFNQYGWRFIDSDTAYQDSIYQIQPKTLPAGESILWSIAQIYGVGKLRYPAEDAPYEYSNLNKFGLDIEP
ncbi:polysaccharide deacetylase family protein [Acinetobacter sp. SH20PTE14]|uniref:polysaccharide deacetylase family protein n=1 Tax=Acinetobacter sp. SH20PTE14 TaxID=2905879 RepID=UPI001F3F1AB5|nr:polysaccharide deacetylase family protein [Acinetobacter sp. SH20PTE14]UIJ77589.1 polysaccharide deacetylase family protein [Acinetobacter sp. SH20PTE14]